MRHCPKTTLNTQDYSNLFCDSFSFHSFFYYQKTFTVIQIHYQTVFCPMWRIGRALKNTQQGNSVALGHCVCACVCVCEGERACASLIRLVKVTHSNVCSQTWISTSKVATGSRHNNTQQPFITLIVYRCCVYGSFVLLSVTADIFQYSWITGS